MLFEKFNAPAIFVCKSAVLSAFASGRSTALVVESGAGSTCIAPVHDGYVLTRSIKKTKIAGQTMDLALEKLLCPDQDPNNNQKIQPLYNVKKEFEG